MTIKQYGGVFGRNPTFNNVTIEGTLTFDGDIDINSDLTISGNLYLPDNSKAIFGDNDDLQIYHDGSNSYVSDQGTGDLRILAADFRIRNAADDETMIQANSDADVSLWYNNSKKLATTNTGIDVTGSVTADGLTVDGDGLFDADNAKVEIKSFAPRLTFTDDSAVGAAADKFIIQSVAAQSSGDYEFVMNNDQTSSADVTVAKFFGNGDISFYNTAGNSQALFWDASAESLGIGTSSPEKPLHVNSGTGNIGVRVESSDATASIEFMDSGTTSTALSPRIGGKFDDFFVQTSGSERMRIDSGGNLLVGKTSTAVSSNGIEVRNNGLLVVTRDSNKAAIINRRSDDGDILEFMKDSVTVGSIGTNSGYMVIGSPVGTDAHLLIGNGLIHPADSAGNAKDNAIDIGGSGNRFKDLYLSGGVVFGTTGGSVSSKTLDDYEEGTWTVTVADAASGGNESSSAVSGTYTKVGKMVYVQFNLSNIDTTGLTAGNDVYITGLPFATASVTGTAKYTGTAQLSVVTFSGTPFLSAVESATVLRIVENISGAGVDFVVVSQLASAASDIHGNLVYQTT